MKQLKQIFIHAFLIVTISHSTIAQNWFEGNPSWSYRYEWYCIYVELGWDRITYKKDTIIEGKSCQFFNHVSESYDQGSEYWFYDEFDFILHEEEGKVYQYKGDGIFDKLYDFTLEIGDTIYTTLNTFEGDSICENPLISIIDNVYPIELNGQELTVQKWRNLNNIDQFGEYFTIIEKIGAIGGFFFDMSYNWKCGLDECYPYDLKCYFNSELAIEYGDSNCIQTLPIVGVDESKKPSKIFPNPSNSIFYIESNEIINSIKIYDLQGKLINSNLSNGNLNFTLEKSGMYVIQLIYENGSTESQKIIKN